jgi:hypothetical protein
VDSKGSVPSGFDRLNEVCVLVRLGLESSENIEAGFPGSDAR